MWSQRELKENPVVWEPKESNGRNMKRLMQQVENSYNMKFDNYLDFHQWSIDHVEEFWAEVWRFFEVVSSTTFDKVVDLKVPMDQSPEWFESARLNYAENLLRHRDDKVALVPTGEDRLPEKVTYSEMYEEAKLYAAAFRQMGLKKNDIVACYMSNRKEAIFAMQATISIGAIWTGSLPLIGVKAFLSTFAQANPKFLITVDRFRLQEAEVDMLPKLREISIGLPSVEKIIIVPSKDESTFKDISQIRNSCFLEEFLSAGRRKDGSVPDMLFEQVPLSHPIFINYTSGTTGVPKALVHGSGVLLGMSLFYGVHMDTSRESRFCSVSPMGWASWITAINLHFLGCTLVLYEGSPYFLSPTSMWDLVDEFQLTHILLFSATIDEFMKRDFVPTSKHSLSSLKNILGGGSIVKPNNYDFIFEKVKKDVEFTCGYGSTEVMGGILITQPTLPMRRGEMNAPTLGVKLETVDDAGNPTIGEVGELVVSNPQPNLALGLWDDEDGTAFRKKYFSKYPGKFALGDYGIINPETKGYVVCCRSDETLNQRGLRFGSAEIYSIVDLFPEVGDSLCVSQYNNEMDERAVLFLRMKDGHAFSHQLVSRVREAITRELTADHVPDVIIETKDIPYNLNGKKVEIVVKKIINKMAYSSDTIKNQESLLHYMDLPELQGF